MAILQQKQGNLSEALSLAERALQIRSQALGDTHLNTVTTRALSTQLAQELACATKGAPSELKAEEIPDPPREEHHTERGALSPHETVDPSPSQDDPLQGFFNACCELHPRAWSRASDLWKAYEQWAAEHQERFPLSRRAFTAELKAHDCRADRTGTARIWRGIAVVNKGR